MPSNFKGFTLVEIMIALSIVAVTFGVIITSASQVRKNGRDAQVQADLQSVQAALQQYYADQNYFPDSINLTAGAPLTNCPTVPASCTISKTYLSVTPISPSSTSYFYRSGVDSTSANKINNCGIGPPNTSTLCHYYILCADLEGTSPQTPSQYSHCDDYNVNYNYQLNP